MLKKFWAKLMGFERPAEQKFREQNQIERELALERQRLAREGMQAQGIIPRKEEAPAQEKPIEERHEEAA